MLLNEAEITAKLSNSNKQIYLHVNVTFFSVFFFTRDMIKRKTQCSHQKTVWVILRENEQRKCDIPSLLLINNFVIRFGTEN